MPLTTTLTDHLLGAFTTTDKTQTTASTDNFLGVFGLTDHTEERVQGLDVETANDEVEPRTPLSQRRRANAFVGSNAELVCLVSGLSVPNQ